MATAQNTLVSLPEDVKHLFNEAIDRAANAAHDKDIDPICHYPLIWLYAAHTGKDWDQVRSDAGRRFVRSRTGRQADEFLASKLPTAELYRNVLEFFSMFLYCKWAKAGSVRRRKWTSFELSLACPENDEAIRRADFQERLDDSIAYLDFDIQ